MAGVLLGAGATCLPAAPTRAPRHASLRVGPARSRPCLKARAEGGGGGQPPTDEDAAERERRIAELERGRRRRDPPRAAGSARQSGGASTSGGGSGGGMAEWREGQLFPEGWDQMSPARKAAELWTGRRGLIFWANKAAWASVFVVIGGWVLFRVVGPLLGLYTLKNDLLSPPNL